MLWENSLEKFSGESLLGAKKVARPINVILEDPPDPSNLPEIGKSASEMTTPEAGPGLLALSDIPGSSGSSGKPLILPGIPGAT